MANKYMKKVDEESLARQIDQVRKTFCSEDCGSCPWKMDEGKCLLLTAEHHISERYAGRLRNLKRHYGKVSKFVMDSTAIYRGGYSLHNQIDSWAVIDGAGKIDVFHPCTALDLASRADEIERKMREKDGEGDAEN